MVSTKALSLKHYYCRQRKTQRNRPGIACFGPVCPFCKSFTVALPPEAVQTPLQPPRLENIYHPFQNHYTHKKNIFELFRSLQLQFLGPTGINFHYSYSFGGPTGIFSLQLQFVSSGRWTTHLMPVCLLQLTQRSTSKGLKILEKLAVSTSKGLKILEKLAVSNPPGLKILETLAVSNSKGLKIMEKLVVSNSKGLKILEKLAVSNFKRPENPGKFQQLGDDKARNPGNASSSEVTWPENRGNSTSCAHQDSKHYSEARRGGVHGITAKKPRRNYFPLQLHKKIVSGIIFHYSYIKKWFSN